MHAAEYTLNTYHFPDAVESFDNVSLFVKSGKARLRFSKKGQQLSYSQLGQYWNARLDEQSSAEPVIESVWTSPTRFVSRITYTKAPYILTLTTDFVGEEVRIQPEWNVSFGPKRPDRLIAKK